MKKNLTFRLKSIQSSLIHALHISTSYHLSLQLGAKKLSRINLDWNHFYLQELFFDAKNAMWIFFLNSDEPVHCNQFVLVIIWFSAEMCLWEEKEKTQINLGWTCMVITLWKLYFCNSLRIIVSTDTGQRHVLFFFISCIDAFRVVRHHQPAISPATWLRRSTGYNYSVKRERRL